MILNTSYQGVLSTWFITVNADLTIYCWGNKDHLYESRVCYSEYFFMAALSLPPHSSTMCLYYHGLVDIHFILWVVRQYCYFILLLQLLWLWPKELFKLTPVYLWHHPLNVCWLYLGVVLFDSLCFEHFLSSCHYKMNKDHLVYVFLHLQVAVSPRSPLPLLLK